MKFVELKKCLSDKIDNCYILYGEDRFLIQSAFSLIENKLNLSFVDINESIIDANKYNIDNLTENLYLLPFGDNYRLILLKDLVLKSNDVMKLNKILKNIPNSTILVIMPSDSSVVTKLKENATLVDCNKLDNNNINKYVINKFNKNNKTIDMDALELLVNYSNNNMTKIEADTDILNSLQLSNITVSEIKKFLIADKDYQIYELTDSISSGDGKHCFEVLKRLIEVEKNYIGLVGFLYQQFRKILYIKMSNDSDEAIGKALNFKPYAVKMRRQIGQKFTVKYLKRIVDELQLIDVKVKTGNINASIALDAAICNILMMRNNDKKAKF